MVELRCRGGRYPGNLARLNATEVRGELTRNGDVVRIRIDDLTNIDAWLELEVAAKVLVAELVGRNGDSA